MLDEPFTGIDPIAIGDIQEIISRLRERGIGILITDHNVRETLAITDRAYIMYDGAILVSGTASEIAATPARDLPGRAVRALGNRTPGHGDRFPAAKPAVARPPLQQAIQSLSTIGCRVVQRELLRTSRRRRRRPPEPGPGNSPPPRSRPPGVAPSEPQTAACCDERSSTLLR
jgi:ABC-type glutathione transport system ATPase component